MSGCRVEGVKAKMMMGFILVLGLCMCVCLTGHRFLSSCILIRCVLSSNSRRLWGLTEPVEARKRDYNVI